MIRKFIKKFIAGDSKRTAFSADAMNEIVTNLNQFVGTRAGKGIVITRAESGWVISWDPKSLGESAIQGEGGGTAGTSTSNIVFRGDWNVLTSDYITGNIVIKRVDPGDYLNESAGTYIAIATVPTGVEPGVSYGWATYWALFAKGFWEHIIFGGAEYTDINGPRIKGFRVTSPASHSTIAATIPSGPLPRSFEWDGGFGYLSYYSGYGVKPDLFIVRVDPNVAIPTLADTDRAIVLDLAACQYTAVSGGGVHPQLLKIREIDICVSGVAKKMLVLCSAPYVP
jgi:hypothetical protein